MNKRIFSILLLVVCLISAFFAFGCSGENNGQTSGSENEELGYGYSFYLSDNSVTLEQGNTFNLIATYGNEVVTYRSLNETVATVTETGLITAKSSGKTQITVSAGGKERICEVTVVTYEYTVSLNKTGTIYAYNDQLTVVELVAYAKMDGQEYADTYSWKSDSEKCTLTVPENTVLLSFNGTGEMTVTVTTGKGATQSVKIIVIDSEASLS